MSHSEDDVPDLMPYDFEPFAHYYDLDQDDYREDIPLYLNLAKQCGSPILELGCGTGRLALPLAAAGYDVTGVDISPRMLAFARKKAEKLGLLEHLHLVEGDMRDCDIGNTFRLAYCGLNTLMHVAQIGDQLAVLRTARRHLRSGGIFALDLPNPHVSTLSEEQTPLLLEKEMTDPISGRRILKLFSQRTDMATQVSHITLIYDELDEDGTVRRTLAPMRMRWLYPYEARLLMELAGFTVDIVYGSYELEPFHARSERMIFLGRVP